MRSLVCAVAGLSASLVVASPLTYATRSVNIRAGVVVIDSQQIAGGFPANWSPHVLYNLDSNKVLKPGGWNFYNPYAPSAYTTSTASRWTAINALYGAPAVNAGDRVTKRNAAYWEVRLSAVTESQLANYDFLHLSAYGFTALNSLERERLRRFIEAGGTLWVDFRQDARPSPSVNFDFGNPFPLGFALNSGNLGFTPDTDFSHPIMNVPFAMNTTDVATMESDTTLGIRDIDFAALGYPDLANLQSASEGEYNQMLPISVDQRGTKIAVGQVGQGYMVVTSRGVGYSVNRVIDQTGTLQVNGSSNAVQPSFDRSSDAGSKLVYNMVSLGSSFGQTGKGASKTNSGFLDVGAPAIKRFNSTETVAGAGSSFRYNPPAIYRGLVITVSDSQVFAYDADPGSDLDGDGNPDDGIVDFALGADRDLVWSSQALTAPISPPTAVEVPDGAVVNQITVVDGQGRLVAFDAFPSAPGTTVPPVGVANPPTPAEIDSTVAGPGPYAPTFHEGLYYIGDQIQSGLSSIGRVWVVRARDLASPGGNWAIGSNTSPVFGRTSGSPTVGYIPIADGSGGLDRVVYLPTRPNVNPGANSTAAIHSLWAGARGEKPFSWVIQGGFLRVITRAHLNGLRVYIPGGNDPLGLRLTILDDSGNPLSAAQMHNLFDGQVADVGGFLNIRFRAGQSIPNSYGVRLDYTVDWGVGTPGYGLQVLRTQLFLPDDDARRRRILGNIALSPEGVVHVVHADPSATNTTGGSYYAFREEKRGEFRMLNRYELHPAHTMALNGAPAFQQAETLFDTDPVTTIAPPILGGSFRGLTYRSGPSVHKGLVYVMARGVKGGFVPCSILMAFNANPTPAEIVVGNVTGSFSIVQPDLARSNNKTTPNVYVSLTQNQFLYEKETGAEKGVIRIDSLMTTTRGFVGNSISRSQPIILRQSGQPDRVIQPDATGSLWSPLEWYSVFHGSETQAPPVGSGRTIFFSASSLLPWFVRNGFGIPIPTAPEAVLYGINAAISPNDPFLVGNAVRPWQKQLYQFKITPTFQGNPNFQWPQTEGIQDFDDWALRVLQTSMGSTTDLALGVAAGENSIVGWSDRGYTTFSKADYVVCDEGRLARFDANGNPIWTIDNSGRSGIWSDSGNAQTRRPLVRPTRAYSINAREMAVVDTGGNRIIRLDYSGRETRSIERFITDVDVPGFEENETRELRQPRDVLVYTTRESNPPLVNGRPSELWIHYLIADAGNKRLIELIDRYELDPVTGRNRGAVLDGSNNPQLGVLIWHSGSELRNKSYVYNSLSRIWIPSGPTTGRWVVAAGIGDAMPTRVDVGIDAPTAGTNPREDQSGNGGIVVLDGANTIVINEVTVPALGANVYFDPSAGTFNSTAQLQRVKRLGNLRSVTMRNVVDQTLGPRTAIMFADSEGVFEIMQSAPNGPWVVRWMITREAYKYTRRDLANVPTGQNARDFTPMYAKRLDNGDVLVVNGYYGSKLNGSQFTGEILQLNGEVAPDNLPTTEGFGFARTNLGFKLTSIKAELPPVQGARGIVLPVFVDRK